MVMVEIYGEDFRYFEPYAKSGDDGSIEIGYADGDKFTDLNSNSKWDDLSDYKLDDDSVEEVERDRRNKLLVKTQFKKNKRIYHL